MDQHKAINTSKTRASKRDYLAIPPVPKTVWTNPLHFIAFGFGTGTIPFAPGTFGTLIAVPFYLALQSFATLNYFIITLFITGASIWICHKATQDIGIDDHQGMCLDEIVGYLVTMIGAPHGWLWVAIGFGLFRFFDIVKPWPIRYVDANVHGGFGMILDDVLAGILSCLVIQVLAHFLV